MMQGEQYAVDLAFVREVLTLGPVTRVPGAPGGVVGAAAVQGRVLPVVDLAMGLTGVMSDFSLIQPGAEALWLSAPPHQLLLAVGKVLEVVTVEDAAASGEMVEEIQLEGFPAAVRLLDLGEFVSKVAMAVVETANQFQVRPFSMAAATENERSGGKQ